MVAGIADAAVPGMSNWYFMGEAGSWMVDYFAESKVSTGTAFIQNVESSGNQLQLELAHC